MSSLVFLGERSIKGVEYIKGLLLRLRGSFMVVIPVRSIKGIDRYTLTNYIEQALT